mgnify:CR=1 FL=1
MPASPSRRSFLVTGISALGLAGAGAPAGAAGAEASGATGGCGPEPEPAPAPPAGLADPFTLGVASGDPAPDGFVIWTRLAPRPLAEDGLGGMPYRPVPVHWEVAEDDRFRHVVRRGTHLARPEWGHSVHVELHGLRPGRDYWYRFKAGGHLSPPGRTRTAPHPAAYGPPLVMAFASCANYEHGLFTAYRHIAEDEPDLVLHLGDYLYENAGTAECRAVRRHEGPEAVTLAGYRRRHAQYKTDPDLRAAHAAAPWLVVWDDHEVDNNWAGDMPEERSPTPPEEFPARRAAAFRAYYENMPLRRAAVPRGPHLRLYRRIRWGRLAAFHLLDTRQYRHDQCCGDGWRHCPESADPARSILGEEQERWLLDGLAARQARWDLIAQQVFFAQRDADAGPLKLTSQDAWDGYAASRDRLIRGWTRAGVRNPVVLTGDVHTHWAAELKADFDDPDSPCVGAELVTTSISSGGDGRDIDQASDPFLAINPHLRYHDGRRGYVRTRITRDALAADFVVVPYVSRPGAPAEVRAGFVVADGEPGLHLTQLRPPMPPGPYRSGADVVRWTIEQETMP